MTGALGLRQVPRLGRMTAFGAERKLTFEVSCFRFCPSRHSLTAARVAEQGGKLPFLQARAAGRKLAAFCRTG